MTLNTIKFSQFASGNLANATNQLVGVTAPSGGTNFRLEFPFTWSTSTRPISPPLGTLGYNVTIGQQEYWNGASWIQLGAGGSGSVNLGSQYQLAYYATTGTAVSGLMSANNSVLTTNSSGIPLWSTSLPSGLTIPIPNITGITNGSNANAGSVGEYISASLLVGSAISLSSGVTTNILSISLTAGDWDVSGTVLFAPNGGNSCQYLLTGITQTSAAFEVPASNNNNCGIGGTSDVLPTEFAANICVGPYRANLTTTTIIYLIAQSAFSSGTLAAYGYIAARRMR